MTAGAGLAEILVVVILSSLFSIGGGNGPIALIQDRWVSSGLLDPALFAWAIALGYMCPGPKAGFLAGIGYFMHGLPGALVAMSGIILPTWAGAAAVSYAYQRLETLIRRVAAPAGFVVAGMIGAAAWNMALPMQLNLMEAASAAAVAVLVAWRNPDPVLIVLGAAGAGAGWWLIAG